MGQYSSLPSFQYGSLSLSICLSHITEDLIPFKRNTDIYIFVKKCPSFILYEYTTRFGFIIWHLRYLYKEGMKIEVKSFFTCLPKRFTFIPLDKLMSPVGWGSRIYQLHLCWGIKFLSPLSSILDMTLNYLLMKLQSWSFGRCGVPLHCHYSQVHSDTEW